MKNASEFKQSIDFVLTDIDDTLTDHGQLRSPAYEALWALKENGIQVVPITGRPAGWCEMIARFWPVAGIVGENGGFYFRYHEKEMQRHFFFDSQTQEKNRQALNKIQNQILKEVPGCAVASDQFCRLMDLAIDFCEDVPTLQPTEVQRIVKIFESHGAQAKVSSIHVNGWFGSYDKLSMSLKFFEKEFGIRPEELKKRAAFCGDSPNDEPMFNYFPFSFGVANVLAFRSSIKNLPSYISSQDGGAGFSEIARQIISNKKNQKN